MTTIREAAESKRTKRQQQFGELWKEHQDFATKVVKQRLGVDCVLLEVDDEEEVLYLVEIHDTEFGFIYIRIERYPNGVTNFYHIFDVYRWKAGKAWIRDSVDLLRLLQF